MDEAAITWFEDPPYEFLSNFSPAAVRLDGVEYPTVEHAYQAAKTFDEAERRHVRSAPTPAEAKSRGAQVTMRTDWGEVKVDVMRDLLRQKFSDPALRERLIGTAPRLLVEGNTWNDRFWGVCGGEGQNWLGRLLMEIRDQAPDPAPPGEWARQGDFGVRFGWGVAGVETLRGDLIVIVDVLRFTTAVEAAASRGAGVFPYRWRDGSAAAFAESVDARLADRTDPLGPSLSPHSLLAMDAGEAVVLPSPNGSTCAAVAAETGATVVAACLRNAAAVGAWAASNHGAISVIACGEQWPDGSLRPALEDLLGAGAVISRLPGSRSPDARAAVAAWSDAAADIKAMLLECPSGRELLERGREDDVQYAAQVDVSDVVPVLRDGAFRRR